MTTLKFKTNINCGSCVKAVTIGLDEEKSIQNWQVALDTPDKVLTVKGTDIAAPLIQNILEEVGFDAEPINSAND